MLETNHGWLSTSIAHSREFHSVGSLRSAQGVITASLQAEVGELCQIFTPNGPPVMAEVIGFQEGEVKLLPFTPCEGIRKGVRVVGLGRRLTVPVGDGLLGRLINGVGAPIDGLGTLGTRSRRPLRSPSPSPLARPRISKPLVTGLRVVDSLMTLGEGQRIALMAGSGVGKSTLLGEMAKASSADVNVVALIGERGREVRPFVDDCLGESGLKRSVVIVATADEQPMLRIRAVDAAVTIANHFREQGKNVLFMIDSITRLATAQREVGLLLDEPPTLRGYTPSVFKKLASILEVMGTDERGSITGIINVLVDGDDVDEPIADAVRSIVDGHIVLDRDLAQHGHYPAVSIPQSLSRVFYEIAAEQHRKAAAAVRDVLATYAKVEDLLRVGAYVEGTSYRIDKAIHLKIAIDDFVKQPIGERTSFDSTLQSLNRIAHQWNN